MKLSRSKMWLVGGAVVSVVLFLVGWFFVVGSVRAQAEETWADVDDMHFANDQAAAKLATLQKQAAEVPAKLAEVESVKRKMPVDPGQAEFVRSIEQQAKTAGVELTGIAPATPTTLADSAEGTVVLPVLIEAEGSYTAIKTFVDELERQTRVFLIVDLEVAAAENEGEPFTLTLNGNYFSLPEGALDNPAPKAEPDQPEAQASAKLPKSAQHKKH